MHAAIIRATIGTAVAALVAAAPLTAQDVPSFAYGECPEGAPEGSRCGALTVWEDRDARSGRTLDLDVIVLEATGPNPRPDPVYVLTGGPGQAATGSAGGSRRHPLRAQRDIVFMNQRGTGGSNELPCRHDDDAPVDVYLGQIFDPELAAECVRDLSERADLTKYQSPYSLDDLDDLREALGHDRINLWGGSYGTRAALVYIRRHEEHVRTAVLNASMSMDQIMPEGMARDAEAAIRGVLRDCADMPDCAAKYPDLDADYTAVVERTRDPVPVTVTDPRNGAEVEALLQPAGFAEALRAMLYAPGPTQDVPRLLHLAATTGDYDGFANFGAARAHNIAQLAPAGMYLSVTCAEDIPFANEPGEYEQGAGTFLADARARSHFDACRIWPRGEVPADFHDPVVSDLPVLIISGTHDPVTPPRWGEAAARTLPNGIHVVVPFGHHGWGGLENAGACVLGIQVSFLAAPLDAPDTDCLSTIRRRPFN